MSGGDFLLPIGTVTLLLADVEGSTRGWERDPDAMTNAVRELDDLLARTVGRHDGVRPVEQGEGDSFVVAFARASTRSACALALQVGLQTSVLRLRIGVHTGEVQLRDGGNYVGPALHRTARLRDAADGGQTVLSQGDLRAGARPAPRRQHRARSRAAPADATSAGPSTSSSSARPTFRPTSRPCARSTAPGTTCRCS